MPSLRVVRNRQATGPPAPRCRVRLPGFSTVLAVLPYSNALHPLLLVLPLAGAGNPPTTPVALLKSPPVVAGPVAEKLLCRCRPGLLPARRTPPLRRTVPPVSYSPDPLARPP